MSKKSVRVLFLHRHANEENGIGGVMEYLHYLPLFLKNHDVDVLLYREGRPHTSQVRAAASFQNGMPVYAGPFPKPKLFSFSSAFMPLINLCKKERIDLLHAQGTYRSGYLALRLSQYTGLPYLVTSHSDIMPSSGRMKKKKTLHYCRKILKMASAVTHLSPPMAEFSHRIYPTPEKSKLIGNGIDWQDWLRYRNVSPQNYMLAIGRLEVEKGFHVLIDAYAKLRKQGVKTSLVLAGAGSAETMLKERVIKQGLRLVTDLKDFDSMPAESVIFTGYVRGELKKKLIAQSKIVLFATQPTLWEEPFGIVQIEAMAAGKPLIASDSVITHYLQKQGLQALTVQADAASAWAEKMAYLLNDEEQQAQMAKMNVENVRQFDWNLIAKQYKDFYCQILANSTAKRHN